MVEHSPCNAKSNQQNLGTIKSSNLCTEIIEYTSPDEVAVCNLASIALPCFAREGKFDFEKLYEVTYEATKNLNKIIDNNYYPIEEARNSNLRHRPIGLGVQGLADAFIMLRLPFESDLASGLNRYTRAIALGQLVAHNIDGAKAIRRHESVVQIVRLLLEPCRLL